MNKLFVLLFFFSVAHAESRLEVGPTQVGHNLTTGWLATFTERISDRYDLTMGYMTSQNFKSCDHPTCEWYLREQIFAGTEIVLGTKKLRFGLGPYIFQNPDRVAPTRFRIGLHLEYRFNDRFGISARHWSTAGSGPDRTICRDPAHFDSDPGFVLDRGSPIPSGYNCKTNDWNSGQDSWLRLTWYFH